MKIIRVRQIDWIGLDDEGTNQQKGRVGGGNREGIWSPIIETQTDEDARTDGKGTKAGRDEVRSGQIDLVGCKPVEVVCALISIDLDLGSQMTDE